MQKIIVFLIVISLPILAMAGEVEIVGFGPGEFAIKGNLETETKEKIINQIASEITSQKSILDITIVGYADNTGLSSENDELGRKRAEQMKLILMQKFPTAKIIALTKGDSENARKVVVSWKINPLIEVYKKEKPNQIIVILGGFLVLLLVIFILYFIKKRSRKQDLTNENIEWVSIKNGGETFRIPIEKIEDGDTILFQLPFTSYYDPNVKIQWRKRSDAVKSLKGCIKNKNYAKQLTELIEKGTIKVINN